MTTETSDRKGGMGAIPHEHGVAFRVWAPHASKVSVIGEFNDWSVDATPMVSEENGNWYVDVEGARIGQEYRFSLTCGDKVLSRIDPYAREVTNSIGNGVIHDTEFDWEGDEFQLPPWNEIVIYELHVGTFNDKPGGKPGTFEDAIARFGHLKQLGVNVIQVMPAAEFAGDFSWGYNPAHIFAVETTYGGPKGFKEFVKAAHRDGFGVVLDVVYNHFGPSDLDLWQFDGWSENGLGGIYFYNDWKSETPWGNTRPDYGRGEVRQFIHDNAMMWLEDYHVDGLRMDMTLYIRTVKPGSDLVDGWSLTQWINRDVFARYPGRITIAEDLQNNEWLTKAVEWGGAGFGAQWDARFVHPIREAVIGARDEDRSMPAVRDALTFAYNGDPFQRVVYSESHDEVANGKARVVSEINPEDPREYFAQKKSTLAAGLVCTAPGIPMLFQGQEFLEGGWFQDTVPLDWDLKDDFSGIVRLYRDLVRLRLNRDGFSRGLCGRGIRVSHVHDDNNMLAYHRWDHGGPGDDVVVVVNLAAEVRTNYTIGFPHEGLWKLRLNSAWKGYSHAFSDHPSADVAAIAGDYDGQSFQAAVTVAPYTLLIYSQDPAPTN
ncbi:MAG: alpha-amylase family glycosyl hydrolase [Planctomycetaceae bacterium]